ncbi:MAG: C1q-like domain-containing protein [Candidatus Thorarchaeota archaeon]|jgi:hypothetical protein
MRKSVLVAIGLLLLAVPVYASSFGDSLSGSGNWGLKVLNSLQGGIGFDGQATNTEGNGIGVQGVSAGRFGRGVFGFAQRGGGKNIGVYGLSTSSQGKGVMGFASKKRGVTYGVFGRADSPDGWGLYTPNNAYVGGYLSTGALGCESGDICAASDLVGADDVFVGTASSSDDDTLWFDITNEYLRWVDRSGEFDLSDDLSVNGIVTATEIRERNSVVFSAFNSAGDACPIATCLGKVEFDTENYDYGNNYDTSLDRFVAPAAGVYHFDAHIQISNQVGEDLYLLFLKINGTEDILLDVRLSSPLVLPGSLAAPQTSFELKLNQNDYVEVYAQGLSYNYTLGYGSTFVGHRVY